jgi:anti-anti-sigma factor
MSDRHRLENISRVKVSRFKITVWPGHPMTAVAISGELDLATGHQLVDAVDSALAAWPADVELDLSGVTFCDCSGLSAILTAKRHLSGVGRNLVIVEPARLVVALVEIAGLRAWLFNSTDVLS